MSELIVNISGSSQYSLELSLHDADDNDSIEVWCATFKDSETNDSYSVYFEVDSSEDLESWDLINIAIDTYKLEF